MRRSCSLFIWIMGIGCIVFRKITKYFVFVRKIDKQKKNAFVNVLQKTERTRTSKAASDGRSPVADDAVGYRYFKQTLNAAGLYPVFS